MKKISSLSTRVSALVLMAAVAAGISAQAQQQYAFSFSENGFMASGSFTVVPTSDSAVDLITGISGSFMDMNSTGNFSGAITSLQTSTTANPDPFLGTFIPGRTASHQWSVDDYFYPAGNAPIVCSGYSFGGGLIDTYGFVFGIQGGYSACVWSNGATSLGTPIEYDVADADASGYLTYPNPKLGTGTVVNFSVQAVPEPSSFAFLGAGLLGLVAVKRRKRSA